MDWSFSCSSSPRPPEPSFAPCLCSSGQIITRSGVAGVGGDAAELSAGEGILRSWSSGCPSLPWQHPRENQRENSEQKELRRKDNRGGGQEGSCGEGGRNVVKKAGSWGRQRNQS